MSVLTTARQVRDHKTPGAYATVKVVPVLGMCHETKSTKEALEYISKTGTAEEREEAYRILYPHFNGTEDRKFRSDAGCLVEECPSSTGFNPSAESDYGVGVIADPAIAAARHTEIDRLKFPSPPQSRGACRADW